jgi:hypothetical protein
MQVKVVSIVAEDLAPLFREVTSSLEDALCPAFASKTYGGGIEQFSVFAVAVDPDESINAKFCAGYNKAGRYSHPLTHSIIRYISVALPFNPEAIATLTSEQVCWQLCESLIMRLEKPGIKVPKGFAFDTFAEDLRLALEIYLRSAL